MALSLSVTTLTATQTPTAEQAPQEQPPFPTGATVAYIDIQRIAAESDEGQVATTEVQKLSEQKLAEIQGVTKELQDSREKLRQGQTVLSGEATLQLQADIDRLQREVGRLNEDAEAEVGQLRQQLQVEFNKKLFPVIAQVATDKGLQFIFSAGDAGLVWADGALDLTSEVIAQFNAATGTPPAAAAPSEPSDEAR
jgi:Skp family chaperone for outer membrane proteins